MVRPRFVHKALDVFVVLACARARPADIDADDGSLLQTSKSGDGTALQALWAHWKSEHQRNYSAEEEPRRLAIFRENHAFIEAENAKKLPYTLGLNRFADLTRKEYAELMLQPHSGGKFGHRGTEEPALLHTGSGPSSCTEIDWTAKGKVTPVKNQGQCNWAGRGCSWAYATTGAIESRMAILGKKLTSLSEHELMDCDPNAAGLGYAFEYVMANAGLCTEEEYPSTPGGGCRKEACGKRKGAISSYKDVATADSAQLEAALCEGPVSIGIEADQNTFQLYDGGILTSPCGSNIDHLALLVGMGTDGGQDYWKVKNSWGDSWGEDGYIRLCRNCDANCNSKGKKCRGQCGLMSQPTYPVM